MKILLYIWQLPQHIVACLLILFCKVERRQEDYKGRKVYFHPLLRGRNGEAVSLGNYIFIDDEDRVDLEAILAHEYGHSRQSLRWGWLYFIAIGLPSVLNVYSGARYYELYPEKQANRLGGVWVHIIGNRVCDYKLIVLDKK